MKKNSTPYIMLAPGTILMLVLVFYPILRTFLYSLQKMKLTEPANTKFIGLHNYITILQDPDFWYALSNSVVILVSVVLFTAIVGMLIALLLNVGYQGQRDPDGHRDHPLVTASYCQRRHVALDLSSQLRPDEPDFIKLKYHKRTGTVAFRAMVCHFYYGGGRCLEVYPILFHSDPLCHAVHTYAGI